MGSGWSTEAPVRIFDCVTVDGRRGTVIGFYERGERTVLVRLDIAGLVEVPLERVIGERPAVASGWSAARKRDETAGGARYDALTRSVFLGLAKISRR